MSISCELGSVVDTMVKATKRSTSWVVNSGIFTDYMDRQVRYEIIQTASSSSLSPSNTFDYQNVDDDIKATAAIMFDEQSVVESVDLRHQPSEDDQSCEC